MNRKAVLALTGAIAIAGLSSAAALAASSGPAVSVQVKTPTKTLVNTTVHGETGWITKGGTPKGVCPGKSAAGALDAATHGKWKGKYYAKYKDLLVTSILGVTPKSPGYWKFLVNGKTASVGVCDVKLKTGEKLGFKLVK
jgi:Domain of unknown function (DUF4430)